MTGLHNAVTGALLTMSILWGVAATANPLAAPEGPVLLRISGDITHSNVGAEAHFDREMLEEFDKTSITTTTIWTEGVQTFTGVALVDLVEAVGAGGGDLTATALNDYAVEVPRADASDDHALLAFERNGKPMSIREKGPLWIVYPYDSDPKFQSEVYYSRSIWQLDRLEITR